MRVRRRAKDTLIITVAVIVALVICELTVRLIYGGRYARRPNFYIADPVLGYRPAPGLDDRFYGPDFSISVRTDSSGYRLGGGGEVDCGKELVLFCGDSYVFGWGVPTEESCASRLDGLIEGRSNGEARLVNLGVGGYGTWQTAFRLERFLKRNPDARIAAAIFVHVLNDPCDNAIAIGYPLGVRRTKDAKPRHRTPIHIANMFSRLYGRVNERGTESGKLRGRKTEMIEAAAGDPALEDILFAFERVETSEPMPARAVFGNRRIDIAGLSRPDDMIEILLERKEMTRIQRDLMREGVNYTHDLLRERGMKIFHIILPTSPDWFAGEMTDILGRTVPSDWNEVVIAGRFPDASTFSGRIFNEHSGGHYSPGFNTYWAGRIMDLLEANQVGNWSEHAIPR